MKKYLHAHAWCCLHAWLLDFRSRALRNGWGEVAESLLLRRRLATARRAFNYAQVQRFSDRNDCNIYYELARISNVLHFALDDRFHFALPDKPLAQIVCEDMGLYPQGTLSDDERANVARIEEYIEAKVASPSRRCKNSPELRSRCCVRAVSDGGCDVFGVNEVV